MTKKSQPTTSNAPVFIVWFVPERENAPWIRLGVLWPTKSGKGYRMNLECLPGPAGHTVILPNEPRSASEVEGA